METATKTEPTPS